MPHPDLTHTDPCPAQRDEQLGREERALRVHALERDTLEHLFSEQLERAVDVAPATAEPQANEAVIDPGNEEPPRRVGALLPEAHHGVDAVARRDEQPEVFERELPVAVGEEDPRPGGRAQAGADRPTVAAAGAVVDHPYARILSSELVGDRPRPVGTSVIDDGDLEVVGKTGQHGQRFFDDRPDVVFFVECWEEEGEAVEPCGHWRPRLACS